MYYPDRDCSAMIEAIKKECEKKHFSPHDLAQKAGISTSTVSYLLNEKTKPQLYTILQICNALDLSIGQLLDREDAREGSGKAGNVSLGLPCRSYDEKDLPEIVRLLSSEKRKLLWIYLDMLVQYDGIQ